MAKQEEPFAELPAGLVDEVIAGAATAGDHLLEAFGRIRAERGRFRQQLENRQMILHESALGYPPIPTTCGTDGSYAIERMLTSDFAAAAAVAVEGLTPPSETRHWEAPHHTSFVAVEPHHEDTATVLRSVMIGRELLLAAAAPHDVVMLDSTLTLPIIYLNQALNKAPNTTGLRCSREFLEHAADYVQAYATMLESTRSDKNFVALPKYSTRREIGEAVGWSGEHDDRGLLTMLLRPGELTKPLSLQRPTSPWHLNLRPLADRLGKQETEALKHRITTVIGELTTFYYKPHPWLPALRVEVAGNIANNLHRLAVVLQGLKHQCATGAMLEPYPLYLADRTVKALARAIPAFRQVATQRISQRYEGDISEVFFAMHGYRSETGMS